MTRAARYRRYGRCTTHVVDSDVFLVTRSTIRHLNSTAAAIWLALEEPATRRELLDILCELFPSEDSRRLATDLGRFLRTFLKAGLVAPVLPPRRSAHPRE